MNSLGIAAKQTDFSPCDSPGSSWADAASAAPGSALDVSLNQLKLLFGQLTSLILADARAAIVLRPLELKIALGYCVSSQIRAADEIGGRIRRLLGGHPELLWRNDEVVPTIDNLSDALAVRHNLLECLTAHSSVVRIVDDPTSAVLESCLAELRRAYRHLEELPERMPSGRGVDGINLRATDYFPGRDDRFEVVEKVGRPRGELTFEQKISFINHFLLMTTEIPTIEACCDLLLTFPESWEFVVDMGLQIGDEARHATVMSAQVRAYGGRIGEHPCDFVLWKACAGEPLAVRLAVHQRIGEWIGADAALYYAKRTRQFGHHEMADIFDFVARDEINHVAIGNKWIRRCNEGLSEGEIHERALDIRSVWGMSSNNYPFNRWACEAGGFTPEMIDRIERQCPAPETFNKLQGPS